VGRKEFRVGRARTLWGERSLEWESGDTVGRKEFRVGRAETLWDEKS
jgi:hypothetical protein